MWRGKRRGAMHARLTVTGTRWIVVVIFLLTTACSQAQPHAERPVGESPFAVKEGGRLYQHYCSVCHGTEGRGDGRFFASTLSPAPTDFTKPEWRVEWSDNHLVAAITVGTAARGKSDLCPAWGETFSSVEIQYLVAYIRELQHQARTVRSQQEEP
jgi:mono/diheme cytochrome c family protein